MKPEKTFTTEELKARFRATQGTSTPSALSQPTQEPKGFLSGVNNAMLTRTQNAQEIMASNQNPVSKFVQRAGQGAAFLGDVATEGLKAVTPDPVEEQFVRGLEKTLAPIVQSKAGQGIAEWAKAHPEAAKNLEAVINIAGVVPIGKAGAVATDVATAGAKKVGTETTKIAQTVSRTPVTIEQLNKRIDYGYSKAVKPSMAGVKTTAQSQQLQQKAREAIKTIVDNKANLQFVDADGIQLDKGIKTPETLAEFRDAIDQTKQNIFTQYNALAKESGARVDLTPIAEELQKVQSNPTIVDLNPQVAVYAKTRAEALNARGSYSTEEAQEAIKALNNSLDAFYRNPTYENASKAAIDALIANNMRKSLDDVIEQTTEGGYQELKNKYAALKSIEKDVVNAAIRDSKKNIKGLIDYSDILSGGQVVNGILTLNPAMVGTGIAQKGIATWYKKLNDPNRAVKKLFETVERSNAKTQSTSKPPKK
jgi:hypothetical protein